MRVLIACETSGMTRRAFQALGHYAVSVDLLESQDRVSEITEHGGHHVGDIFDFLSANPNWDLMIAHPDCTYLTSSAEWCYKDVELQTKKMTPGVLYGAERRAAREEALNFVRRLMSLPIPRIAIENPVGKIGTAINAKEYGFSTQKATQYIQPYEYGHDASKKTGLWLKGLPKLVPDPGLYVMPRMVGDSPRWANQTDSGQNRLPPGKDRWQLRANTYQGWADAMAKQWGNLC